MKVVAYNIKEFEKEVLAIANAKVHDLTLISNPLNFSTMHYANGKHAVIISEDDRLDGDVLQALKAHGVTKIVTRSPKTSHIDLHEAELLGMQIANTPCTECGPREVAEQAIRNLNLWKGDPADDPAISAIITANP